MKKDSLTKRYPDGAMAISMLLMELCDASATDVKVFYLILSANRLVLSPTIIIRAIIIVQVIGKETIPFMTLNIGKEEFGFHHICQKMILQIKCNLEIEFHCNFISTYSVARATERHSILQGILN